MALKSVENQDLIARNIKNLKDMGLKGGTSKKTPAQVTAARKKLAAQRKQRDDTVAGRQKKMTEYGAKQAATNRANSAKSSAKHVKQQKSQARTIKEGAKTDSFPLFKGTIGFGKAEPKSNTTTKKTGHQKTADFVNKTIKSYKTVRANWGKDKNKINAGKVDSRKAVKQVRAKAPTPSTNAGKSAKSLSTDKPKSFKRKRITPKLKVNTSGSSRASRLKTLGISEIGLSNLLKTKGNHRGKISNVKKKK